MFHQYTVALTIETSTFPIIAILTARHKDQFQLTILQAGLMQRCQWQRKWLLLLASWLYLQNNASF